MCCTLLYVLLPCVHVTVNVCVCACAVCLLSLTCVGSCGPMYICAYLQCRLAYLSEFDSSCNCALLWGTFFFLYFFLLST